MIKNNNLGLFVIISIHADASGHLEKGLFIYRTKEASQDLTATYSALIDHLESIADMKLSDKKEQPEAHTGGSFTFFKIGNHAYTRKAFEAIVKKYYF